MSLESYTSVLEAFGQSIGLADAVPDEEGYCAMSFDDLIVHFQYDGDADEVTLFSRLGEVDEDRTEDIYGMLLAANLFWQGTQGATISVEPDSRIAFIADKRPIDRLSDATFPDWLDRFVRIAEYWQQRLEAVNAGGPLVVDDDDISPGGPGEPSMTRV